MYNLRPEHIQNLYNSKLRSGTGVRTIEIIHAVIRRCLSHAVKLGCINRNPAFATTPPRSKHKEMKIFDEREVGQFLMCAKGSRNEALYHLAIATGLRQSELLGLQWNDVDWAKRSLVVQRQLKRKFKAGDYYVPPKTRSGRRTIVLGIRTVGVLQEHLKQQGKERVIADQRWEDNDLVFPSTVGTPLNHSNLYRSFKKLLELSGLPEIRFHDLRHTAASLMLNHGVPGIIVSRRLGHSKVSTTLDIYGHLIPERQNEAAELIDDLIFPVPVDIK